MAFFQDSKARVTWACSLVCPKRLQEDAPKTARNPGIRASSSRVCPRKQGIENPDNENRNAAIQRGARLKHGAGNPNLVSRIDGGVGARVLGRRYAVDLNNL